MSRRQDEELLRRAIRLAAGQRDPDVPASAVVNRYRLARDVQASEPALSDQSLETIAGTIIPLLRLRSAVAALRPDLTPQRISQIVNSWQGEGWFGDGYTLPNSLQARTERQKADARAAHIRCGALGGRPPKPR